jgi:putative DNA primase/helicase
MNQPRFIDSVSPFKSWAEKYRSVGYISPIPLPPGKKNPPPTGFTGHGGSDVGEQQLAKWLAGTDPGQRYPIAKCNIGIRLSCVGDEFEMVGIDVDHHPEDKDDPKEGGPQLEYLETLYGKLPSTWTSSARTNGVAGIRFFLAPKGLAWRGDCGVHGPDIDIISRCYRFAVVFPSINPDAGNRQYWWYPPGFRPDGDLDSINRDHWGLIPNPARLPHLPDPWVNWLTDHKTPEIGVPQDMNSTPKQLMRWALKSFAPNDEMCEYLEAMSAKWIKKLENPKGHDILTAAHYHMLMCGSQEWHHGWKFAVKAFEKAYVETVLGRHKRTLREAEREIERSRTGALRKIKGAADEKPHYFGTEDPCDLVANQPGPIIAGEDDIVANFPRGKAKTPDQYTLNDDGNAEHWLDLHAGLVLYVYNVYQKWIIWDGERWHVDDKDVIAHHLYRRVKEAQVLYANKVYADYLKVAGTPKATELKTLHQRWTTHARQSGMTPNISRALEAAKSVRGEDITIKFEDLDSDRRALGVQNGVVRFKHKDEVTGGNWRDVIEVVENDKSLLLTKNTGVPYIPFSRQQDTRGYLLFVDFLQRFIAPSINLKYFQKLCGSCLLGINTEKMALFFWGEPNTGKSTIVTLMLKAIGEGYGCTRNPDIFRSVHLNPALASALSTRIMAVGELGDNTINSDLFKNLSGGHDPVTCELKGKNNLVTSIPQFTILVHTNNEPNVPGEDVAFHSRLWVVPFKHEATDAELTEGKEQQTQLLSEGLTACLAWLIEGCAKFVIEGLHPKPAELVAATKEFVSNLSDISSFARDWLAPDPGGFVQNKDLLNHFVSWAVGNNLDIRGWSQPKLSRRLKDLGFKAHSQRGEIDGKRIGEPMRGFKNIKMVKGKEGSSDEM